jgi:hypothetical protein
MGAKVWVWSEWIIAIGIQDRIQRANGVGGNFGHAGHFPDYLCALKTKGCADGSSVGVSVGILCWNFVGGDCGCRIDRKTGFKRCTEIALFLLLGKTCFS